jgi:hypothetical protein
MPRRDREEYLAAPVVRVISPYVTEDGNPQLGRKNLRPILPGQESEVLFDIRVKDIFPREHVIILGGSGFFTTAPV